MPTNRGRACQHGLVLHPLRQILPKYHLALRRLHPIRRLPPIPQIGKYPHAVHHRALRVLRDHRIHRPVHQQRPRIRREAVADEHDLAVCTGLFQRPADAFGPTANVVEACQVDVLHQGELFFKQVQKARLALLVDAGAGVRSCLSAPGNYFS